jgi:hypothetical protein
VRGGVRVVVTLGAALLVASVLERVHLPLEELVPQTRTDAESAARSKSLRPIRIELIEPKPVPRPKPTAEPKSTAELEPEPEPKPAQTASAPVPPPPPPARPAPVPAKAPAPPPPALSPLESGRELLRAGRFPRLRATYARIGFPAYRDAMSALGGRFFLYDPVRRQTVAEIDPRSGRPLRAGAGGAEAELSRWPRDVTQHLEFALRDAPPELSDRASRVILLPPADVDATLLGAVAHHLRGLGLDPATIARLDLAYELYRGRLRAEVITVATRDGAETPLALAVDLAAPGRRT